MLETVNNWVRIVRSDSGGQARITGRKIYILPTRYGFLFGILLAMLLIGSINYANNPAFLLTFLLAGLFIHTIFHTWRNLLGLSLRWQGAAPVFAGEPACFQFQLSSAEGRNHYAIQLSFKDQQPSVADMSSDGIHRQTICNTTSTRGILRPGRITVETRYPLGLLRAWSYLETDASVIVYPAPGLSTTLSGAPDYQGSQTGNRGAGTEDFLGHRGYHPGDHPRHMNWKAYASGKGLLLKQFGGDRAELLWLDYDHLTAKDTEARLSILCRSVLDLSRQQVYYGLRLPDREIAPGNGQKHLQQCLSALALFGIDP